MVLDRTVNFVHTGATLNGDAHMIRKAIVEAVRLAFTGQDRKGYMHHVHVMYTSQKWSAL